VRRPVIGITTYREHATWGPWDDCVADVQSTLYVDAVSKAGAVAVLLPPIAAQAADAIDAVDALLLTGGADVDPARYGADPHPQAGPFRTDRDESESALVAAAIGAGRPVLAICRGMQLLNVALGGALVQHLPDDPALLAHEGVGAQFVERTVTVDAGSWLAAAVGTAVTTACHHHQAIARVADSLHVVARADDGTPEAIESTDGAPVIGVQWHPEQLADGRLFEAFVRLVDARSRNA
jgi:putative glutamine amidotransferase